MDRVQRIRDALHQAFQPQRLEVIDESHLHAGHRGALTGKGHFRVELVAEAFTGMSLLQRHRRVYEALGTLMETEIHALSIQARSPAEP